MNEYEQQEAVAASTRIYTSDNIAVRSILKKVRDREASLVALTLPKTARRVA